MDDSWIEQLERDLKDVEDISRAAENTRALRASMISANAPDWFEGFRRDANKVVTRLSFEFYPGLDSFAIRRRAPFAEVTVSLNTTAQTIKFVGARAAPTRLRLTRRAVSMFAWMLTMI